MKIKKDAVASNTLVCRTGLKSRLAKDFKKNTSLYLLAIPVIIYYVVFVIAPLCGTVIAFQNYSLTKGVFGSKFVGFKHFSKMFETAAFWNSFKNTLQLSIMRLIMTNLASVVVSVFLNEMKNL